MPQKMDPASCQTIPVQLTRNCQQVKNRWLHTFLWSEQLQHNMEDQINSD